jgi:hypothetical protein
VAIFTNRLVRQGKCLLWKHGWEDVLEIAYPAPTDPNHILTSNPLSRPDSLREVLAFVAGQFDPQKYDFVLITKSHGSTTKAITPRLTVRAEETSRAELLRVASEQIADDELPEWAGRLGISKAEYFAILNEARQRHGMHFSLVYMEACNANTEEVRQQQLPANVDRLMYLRDDANYINLLYADILQGMARGDRLSDAVTRNLPSKFLVLSNGVDGASDSSNGLSMPLWAYFIPLIVWMAWVLWRLWMKKRVTRHEAL